MTLRFRPFLTGHLDYLRPQPAQRAELAIMRRLTVIDQLERHVSLSAWDGNTCVGAGGLLPCAEGECVAWLVLSENAGRYMVPVVRRVRRVIAVSPYGKVNISVAPDFPEAERLARLAGATRDAGADGVPVFDANGELAFSVEN